MKLLIISGLVIVFLTACGSATDAKKDAKNIHSNMLSKTFDEDGLKKINYYRLNSGLTSFTINELLTKAAQNHAKYQIENNLYTHKQNGTTPNQRLLQLGYPHNDTSENIYAGDTLAQGSVDILFSNIYHRLVFLDFGFDEIGLGMDASLNYTWKKVYTYELGRENSRSFNQKQHPKVIVYPYKNQQDVMPVFYEESPDPLPECSVSGYPISIQFNPSKNGKISLDSFNLYDESNSLIKSKLLKNDIHLSNKEFVLMPLSRLEFATTYQVEANYKDGDKSGSLTWEFTTKSLPEPYFVVKKSYQNFQLKSGETYHFYIQPQDCNDKFTSYTYTPTKGVKVQERMIDNNTIKLKVIGEGDVIVKLDNGKSFKVEVSK